MKEQPLHLFDSAATIAWIRARRVEMKRELRRLKPEEFPEFSEKRLRAVAREKFLKRAIRAANKMLATLSGKAGK